MLLNKQDAAVLVLHDLNTDSLILTKRSELMTHHPGEVCFPGGLRESEDNDYSITALRELQEELGIESSRVTLIKELKVERTALGSLVHPWLATIGGVEPYLINTQEVSRVIPIPMSVVCHLDNYKMALVETRQIKIKSCQFVYPGELIWGVTARIMRQLCC